MMKPRRRGKEEERSHTFFDIFFDSSLDIFFDTFFSLFVLASLLLACQRHTHISHCSGISSKGWSLSIFLHEREDY